MLPEKPRKPETNEYKSCPECGAVKRYVICIKCGWMDEKTKKKDKELLEALKNSERTKPKVKRQRWDPL